MAQIKADEITKLIREQIENYESKVAVDEVGTVIVRTDGVHIQVEAKGEKWELARDSVLR